MRRDNPAPPTGEAQNAARRQRNAEAVIAQYIQDLTRAD
jgi:hypothetical protein